MNRHALFLSLLATCAMSAASASAATAADFAAPMRQLDQAVTHGKLDELQQARAAFTAMVADDPGSQPAQYGLALADWRLLPLLGSSQADLGRRLCKEGIAACDRVLTSDPRAAEALALKAGIQGISLSYVPMAMMSLGPEIAENNSRARGLAPDNPRVLLLVGIGTLHTPAFVGGGAGKAKPLFESAIAHFEAEGADTTGVRWGRVDAYLWSGRCLAELKDWAGARDRYRQALAIEPEHAWIRHALLPEAEKRLAMKAGSR